MNGERHRWRRASPKKERTPGDACGAATPEIHKYELTSAIILRVLQPDTNIFYSSLLGSIIDGIVCV
jgi:hypothetical protein